MTTVNSLWLTIVKYQMISGQKQGSEFKNRKPHKYVDNLFSRMHSGFVLLWGILTAGLQGNLKKFKRIS